MGVQDLMPWVRKAHPGILTTYRKRWAAQPFRNKRVAIDATLLTNAFHFGRKTAPGLEGKGAIIGWYTLITSMRAQGVQPIAIWDQRGTRQWKAAEARKRLVHRAVALARRNHEDGRIDRLHALRYSFSEYDAMTEVEKEVIRSHWAKNGWTRYGPPSSLPSASSSSGTSGTNGTNATVTEIPTTPPVSTSPITTSPSPPNPPPSSAAATSPFAPSTAATPTTPPLDSVQEHLQDLSAKEDTSLEQFQESLEKITTFLDSFSSILQDYHQSDRPFRIGGSAKMDKEEITDAIDHVREFEVFTGEEVQGGIVEGPNKEERLERLKIHEEDEDVVLEDNAIDEKIQELVPPETFRESPRQTEFTKEEGRIIEAFMGLATSKELEPWAIPARYMSKEERVEAQREQTALKDLASTTAALERELADQNAIVDGALMNEPEESTEVEAEAARSLQEVGDVKAGKPAVGKGEGVALAETEADTEVLIESVQSLIQRAPAIRETYARRLDIPTRTDHEDCRDLLVRMGVPVLEARVPYEAEGLASSLAKAGLVDFVGTEDSDVLAYEGPLLKGLSSESRSLVYVSGKRLRQATNLDSAAFLEFCILLGTDASPRIPKVGPMTAFKLVQHYGTIENILEAQPGIRERLTNVDEFLSMVKSARKVFQDYPPIPEGVTLEQGVWNEKDVDDYLEEKHGFRFLTDSNQANGGEEWRFEDVEEAERLAAQ